MQMNITSLLWQAEQKWPERPFLQGSNPISFQEAKRSVGALMQHFARQGIEAGDRVIILAPNHVDILLTMFALNGLGAVAIIVHEQTVSRNLNHIVEQVQPKLALLGQQCLNRADCFPNIKVVELESIESVPACDGALELADGADRTALIIYTSGSTGMPRGVMLSHQNLLFVTSAIQQRLEYTKHDRIGLFLPLSFDYGLYQVFLAALSGACVVVRDSRHAGPVLAGTLQLEQITVLPLLPNLLEPLLVHVQRRGSIETLSSLRLVTNTGAHWPACRIRQLQELLPETRIYPMYGLTECKRVSILTPDEIDERPCSVGLPLDGTQAWVVDECSNPVKPGETGELVVEGPHVAQGYWRSPMETALRFRLLPGTTRRVLYTGDLFTQDESGYLYFQGRKDDQIKRHGFRINRLEIERAALEIRGISSASLVNVADHLVLFVAATPGTITEHFLLEELKGRLEPYKIPDRVQLLDSLPLTRNGKIDSHSLREQCDVQH